MAPLMSSWDLGLRTRGKISQSLPPKCPKQTCHVPPHTLTPTMMPPSPRHGVCKYQKSKCFPFQIIGRSVALAWLKRRWVNFPTVLAWWASPISGHGSWKCTPMVTQKCTQLRWHEYRAKDPLPICCILLLPSNTTKKENIHQPICKETKQ